jgi:endonuclease/exonuclease/phosphatase family metal-dependent hydrolase
MKTVILQVFAIAYSFMAQAQEPVNIMSFNIRFNNPGDSLNAWPYRKDIAASQILFHDAQLVGVQEARHEQMIDLKERLRNYQYVGGGRDDGKEKGEYSAIFVDTSRFKILRSETFWLSQHPEQPGSKGWDADFPRIVTWAHLEDKRTGRRFYVFNTHFDHIGTVARRESANLLLRKVKEIAGDNPAVITGDFNAKPLDEPIRLIIGKDNPLRLINSAEVSKQPHYGPTGTFNAFANKERDDSPIDYIFITKGIEVLQHATLSQTWQGRFSSDHFPVFAKIKIL